MKKKILVVLISSAIETAWGASPVPPNQINKLDDVIVTATRTEMNTAEAPASVTVINRQEIEAKSGENIVDLIRGTTGISLQGVGTGGRRALSLRGMNGNHTLILVDGNRIPSTNDTIGPNTDYQYDWIPTGSIERIEVVRGPMSVLYGADALGGVVNIITTKASKKLEGNFKLSGNLANGEFDNDGDGHNAEVNLSGSANKKLQFKLGLQQSRRASVESKLKPNQSAIEGRNKQQVSLGLDLQPSEGNNINLDVIKGQEDRWYDTETRSKIAYQSQYDVEREMVTLGWKGSVGSTTPSLKVSKSTIDIVNNATNGVSATAPQKLENTGFEGNISFSLGQKHFITTGLEHRTEKLNNDNLAKGEEKAEFKSLYLQDEIDLTDNLVFTLGARLDDHNSFGNETSPRASIVWNTTDQLTLKASYGHGFHAPNIKQSSADYVFSLGTIKVTGNPDLKPETNDVFELGANYSIGKFTLDTAIYDNKVKDLIELTGPITDRSYANIDEARLKGAEVSTTVALRKNLNLKTGYQYLDAKDGDGNRLEHRPRHSLSSAIFWDKNSWKLNLGAEYLSGQIIEHNRVSTDVPGYTVWNAGVKKVVNKYLNIGLNVKNLTDIRLEDESPAFLHEEYPRTIKLELTGKF